MTVNDLRSTLIQLVALLDAAGAKATTTKALAGFIEDCKPFGDSTLAAFIKFAEQGRNPPAPKPTSRTQTKKANPDELANQVKHLYDHAAEATVTEDQIRETCGRLDGLTKAALVKVAERIELFGMNSKVKGPIVTAITQRLLERKGATTRRQLLHRPDSQNGSEGSADQPFHVQ